MALPGSRPAGRRMEWFKIARGRFTFSFPEDGPAGLPAGRSEDGMVQDREGAFHLFVSRGWPCLILIKKTPPPNHCFFTMKPKSVSLFRFHPRRPPFSVSLVFYNETAERFTFSFHSVSGFRFHTVFGLNYCFFTTKRPAFHVFVS